MLNITNAQKEILLEYLPDLEQSISDGDIENILDELDDKIVEIGLDDDQNLLNEKGLKLQRLYDELYNQN